MDSRIQNSATLATSEFRKDALAIVEAGLAAINVGVVLEKRLTIVDGDLNIGGGIYPLKNRRVYFIGVGKCAFVAAAAIEKILGDALTGGFAIDPSPVTPSLKKITAREGTHPLPTEKNEAATKQMLDFLSGRHEDDLVIMIISGGGSTLLCSHDASMTCADESMLFEELTRKGASIQEINTVRRHTSHARGGGLAVAAYPAEVLSFIISDVPGNDIEYISSGPTICDPTTVENARAVLKKYDIPSAATLPLIETPKEAKYFDRVTNILFLSNQDALHEMQVVAAKRGYTTQIGDECFTGEASAVGKTIAETLHHVEPKTVVLYSGEATVTLGEHPGTGGRNQELALAALPLLTEDELIVSIASDGHDNTDHAGAIADKETRTHALEKNLSPEEYVHEHRSYDFFKSTGDALVTGLTGSNVSDIIIGIKK